MASPRALVGAAQKEGEFAADGRTCARCGADKDEARKYGLRCVVPGYLLEKRYKRHMWKWSMDDE